MRYYVLRIAHEVLVRELAVLGLTKSATGDSERSRCLFVEASQ